jgi:formylglycine-generating enzyme required for sulfatase activity
MGSPTSEVDRGSDETQHQVTLSAFKMSKYEVTVGQYRLYSAATGVSMPEAPVWGWNDDDPMCMVTQYDASEFAKWMGCRLPTEAEWEYACRAGTKTRFWFGDLPDKEDRDKYMLFNQETPTADNYPELFSAILLTNSKNRQGNAWGLVDMHGSMWEWCSDWYGDYSTSAQTNPKGATTGSDRVLRGGGWRYDAISCRSAFRYSGTPDYRGDGMGFRLVSPK